MRILIAVSLLLFACTKPNPNRCCIDEQNCAAQNLPNDSVCDDGLVCRGNQCIAQICESSANCDPAAPYCIVEPDGRCQETCTMDTQCPGFGQTADATFCADGACVACRTSDDCGSGTPVCDAGTCVTCSSHEECASGACATDGTCAAEGEIAYVDSTTSATSECTRNAPCSTIARGLTVTPTRMYVVIESGNYPAATAIETSGHRWLIGRGASFPVLTRTTVGPIIAVLASGADITLENLEVRGARSGTTLADQGHGIRCNPSGSPASVRIRNSVLIQNAMSGIRTVNCNVDIVATTLSSSGDYAANLINSIAVIDRSLVTGNAGGLYFDNGLFTLTNSFITRNPGTRDGVFIYSNGAGNRIEFNTIVDNGGMGLHCQLQQTATGAFANNIIARNLEQTNTSPSCTYPGSIIVETDITPLKFKSPEVAPNDYHLMAGSIAIDQATVSALDHDFDGDARPQGAGRDVGADELQ